MTYREMMDERNDEIMRDVRERQAHVLAMYERHKGDPEGLKRERDAIFARLGCRLEPVGDTGMSRLVNIAPGRPVPGECNRVEAETLWRQEWEKWQKTSP